MSVLHRLRERVKAGSSVNSDDSSAAVKGWSPAAGIWLSQHQDEGMWQEIGIPGVSVRVLNLDRERMCVTTLVKIAPGASYPRHRHAGPEECYVIDGDIHVSGAVLGKGDYQRAEAESIHEVQSTEGGCTLLIVSSLRDRILE